MNMNKPANITVKGVDGSIWHVSGDNMGLEGVELDVSPQGIYEAPRKTLWNTGAFQAGASYAGHRIEALDAVLSFNVFGDNGEHWEDVDDRFRAAWDYDRETQFVYDSGQERWLWLRLMEEPKFEPLHDPRLGAYGRVTLTVRAGWPLWESAPEFSSATLTNSSTMIQISNPTDTPCWLEWAVDGDGVFTLPDRSWIQGDKDALRAVATPSLTKGVTLTIATYPLTEPYVASDGSNIAGRFGGVLFLYPVPPHTPMTYVQVAGGTGVVECRMKRFWNRPYGGAKK